MQKSGKVRLTQVVVDRMGAGSLLWDTEIQGLFARCQETKKVLGIKYTSSTGRQRWLTLGTFGAITVEQARTEARKLLGQVAAGSDPASKRDAIRKAPLVKDCAIQFITQHAKHNLKPNTAKQYQDVMEDIVIPAFGQLKMQDLTRQDVAELHQKLSNTPFRANRVLAVLSKFCNWAEVHGLRSDNSNPCRLVKHYKENKRTRYLNRDELLALGQSLRKAEQGWQDYMALCEMARLSGTRVSLDIEPKLKAPPQATAAIMLLLLTGARKNEIAQLKWDDVDFASSQLHLADTKTGERVITLSRQAVAVLTSLPRQNDNPYVIYGEGEDGYFQGLQKVWERIRKDAGLDDVRLHDLRHTYASISVGLNYSLHITGGLLGHNQPSTTHRYAHLHSSPLHEANQGIGDSLGVVLLLGAVHN